MNEPHLRLTGLSYVRLLSGLGFFILFSAIQAQCPTGSPFIRNYPPAEYKAHNQNWSVVQDHRGIMYFANGQGILEYDGASWRTIGKGLFRSLDIDPNGRIYAGSYNDFGYLVPDPVFQLQFVSLLSEVDEKYHDFSDVWVTIATPSGIYFMTRDYLFRWDGSKMKIWNAHTQFASVFEVNHKIYVAQMNKGLMKIENDSLKPAPAGEKFSSVRTIVMLPVKANGKDQILVGTRTNGLWLYDERSLEPFSTPANSILGEGQIFCGIQLPRNRLAIGTIQNGIVVLDENGNFLQHIDKTNGLQDETIWSLYNDRQQGLWAGTNLGISRIEVNSTLTEFTESDGLEGSIVDIVRKDDVLYLATTSGTFYLEDHKTNRNLNSKINRVAGVSPQSWSLLPFKDFLLAGTFDGIYEIHNGRGESISEVYTTVLHQSQRDPNRVIACLFDGMESFYYENGKWKDEGRIEGIKYEIKSILESPDDHQYWIGTRYDGLFRLDFPGGFNLNPHIIHFDSLHGLPPKPDNWVTPFHSKNGIRFSTAKGIYYFDKIAQSFFQDTTLIPNAPEDQEIYSIKTDNNGDLWMVAAPESGVARLQTNGNYLWESGLYNRIKGQNDYESYPDPLYEEITWLGGDSRLFRYDASMQTDTNAHYNTLIRQITINDDSVLYGGSGNAPDAQLILNHSVRSVRFNFSAPSFDAETATSYQHMLEGYDTEWSNWSSETYVNYSRLPAGEYRFLVRAKNIYDQVGETAYAGFRFMPPFYSTWWAYAIYSSIIATVLFLLWQNQLVRLKQKHLRELKLLEYDKLKELDQLKSRFFADISHEFRTPLTLILGPVENILANKPDNEYSGQFQMIRRNAHRLLRLINQLLDLSKLEAGKMKLDLSNENIIPVIKGMVHSFESYVKSKKIELSISDNMVSAYLDFDRDKIEQVLSNLISNAVKFTPPGGKVKVDIKKSDKEDYLEIKIADTGPGISHDQLPFVFDRYYQGNEAAKSGEPGTGIGLALAKEFVELHHGSLTVESIEGIGATFILKLPVKAHPEQLVNAISKEAKVLVPRDEVFNSISNLLTDQDLTSENTLLLVEDNMDMRVFIRESLSGNYKVIEAIDGQEGLGKAFESIPDIIISDVMMPRKDGLEFCEELKRDERTSHIPVILLTAKADIESRLAGLQRGADDYLAKPFNRDELIVRAKNLLDQRQRLRSRYSSFDRKEPVAAPEIIIEDAFIQKIRSIIESHLSDSELEIEQLSRMAGMSRSQLFRKIKALTGQSPSLFIRGIRLHRAKELLQSSQKNVSEVAYEVGFSSPAYFSDAFAETFGFRPSQLKN